MRLAVITPIGPGHELSSHECTISVKDAWEYSPGPFMSIQHERWDDTQGKQGRSRARNRAVTEHPDADWFFFLDADDLCEKQAFIRLRLALDADPDLVAVFGAICTDRNGIIGENVYPLDWGGLLTHGAAGTLSMGCFVRADVARAVPFNESMDAAEDFDFYLRLLRGRRWAKIAKPLVTIRTRVPSAIGPRGYESLDWRAACQAVVDRCKAEHALSSESVSVPRDT